jgi:hypothetical protein
LTESTAVLLAKLVAEETWEWSGADTALPVGARLVTPEPPRLVTPEPPRLVTLEPPKLVTPELPRLVTPLPPRLVTPEPPVNDPVNGMAAIPTTGGSPYSEALSRLAPAAEGSPVSVSLEA